MTHRGEEAGDHTDLVEVRPLGGQALHRTTALWRIMSTKEYLTSFTGNPTNIPSSNEPCKVFPNFSNKPSVY